MRSRGGMTFAPCFTDRAAGRFPCPFPSVSTRSQLMRPLLVIGVLLILFGIAALAFQGVTFFTTERVVDAGPFAIDVHKPHTIVFHPVVGLAALAGGTIMVVAGSRALKTTVRGAS